MFKAIIFTSVAWISLFVSCAEKAQIKTWAINQDGLVHNIGPIKEVKSFTDANGYRCYSEADDTTWREQYALYSQCCNSK